MRGERANDRGVVWGVGAKAGPVAENLGIGEFGEHGGGALVEIGAGFGRGSFVEAGFGFGGGADEDFIGPGQEIRGAFLHDVAEVE